MAAGHREHGAHPLTPVYARGTGRGTGDGHRHPDGDQNGTLSFEGTEGLSKTVDVGSEVTVLATADDGYFADSLSVFTSETRPKPSRLRTEGHLHGGGRRNRDRRLL